MQILHRGQNHLKKKTLFREGGYLPPLSAHRSVRKCPLASLNATKGLLLLTLAAVPKKTALFIFRMMGEPGALYPKNNGASSWNHLHPGSASQTCLQAPVWMTDCKYWYLTKHAAEKWNCFSLLEQLKSFQLKKSDLTQIVLHGPDRFLIIIPAFWRVFCVQTTVTHHPGNVYPFQSPVCHGQAEVDQPLLRGYC